MSFMQFYSLKTIETKRIDKNVYELQEDMVE